MSCPHGEPGTGTESVAHGTLPPAPRLVVSVTDDGPGIPADLLPDLFERFTRADTSRSHATNASSTGLGLAIVDAVVAAHQGAVLVTSRPGMTRFTIVLARAGRVVRARRGCADGTEVIPATHKTVNDAVNTLPCDPGYSDALTGGRRLRLGLRGRAAAGRPGAARRLQRAAAHQRAARGPLRPGRSRQHHQNAVV